MAPAALKKCNIVAIHPNEALKKQGWSRDQLKNWVAQMGGTLQAKLDEETTHIVCDRAEWDAKGVTIQAALNATADDQDIKIVSADWLIETLTTKKKAREGKFRWEKILGTLKPGGSSNGVDDGGGVKNATKQVFEEYTEQFVDPREKKQLELEAAEIAAARKRVENEEKRKKERERAEEARKRKETAALVRRGAKKSRSEIFGENHHIYTDDCGFAYEAKLLRDHGPQKGSERQLVTLYVFESNEEPRTYAMSMHFAATFKRSDNRVLGAVGVNMQTATRSFRKAFRELTGVDWANRLAVLQQHIASERRLGKELTAQGQSVQPAKESRPSEKQPFCYLPPKSGMEDVVVLDADDVDFSKSTQSPENAERDEHPKRVEQSLGGSNGAAVDSLDTAVEARDKVSGTLDSVGHQDASIQQGTSMQEGTSIQMYTSMQEDSLAQQVTAMQEDTTDPQKSPNQPETSDRHDTSNQQDVSDPQDTRSQQDRSFQQDDLDQQETTGQQGFDDVGVANDVLQPSAGAESIENPQATCDDPGAQLTNELRNEIELYACFDFPPAPGDQIEVSDPALGKRKAEDDGAGSTRKRIANESVTSEMPHEKALAEGIPTEGAQD